MYIRCGQLMDLIAMHKDIQYFDSFNLYDYKESIHIDKILIIKKRILLSYLKI